MKLIMAAGLFLVIISLVIVTFYPSPPTSFPYMSDYTSFLATAKILRDGRGAELYDIELQAEYQYDITQPNVPSGGAFLNLRPPFFALYILPFALIDYIPGYLIWLGLSLLFGAAGIYLIVRILPVSKEKKAEYAFFFGLFALAFYPIFDSLILAQTVIFEFLIYILIYLLLSKKKEIAAGFLLGLIAYKPQVLLIFIVFLLIRGSWRAIISLSVVLLVFGVISLGITGIDGIFEYLQTSMEVTSYNCRFGQYVENQQNWRGIISGWLVPGCGSLNTGVFQEDLSLTNTISNALNLVTAAITLALIWINRRSVDNSAFSIMYGAILITAVIASPHAYSHEMTRFVFVLALLFIASKNLPGVFPKWVSAPLFGILFVAAGFLNLFTVFHRMHLLAWVTVSLMAIFWIGLLRLRRMSTPHDFKPNQSTES